MKNLALKDVAKLAGVSPKTVSRVINNEDRVSDNTREKVQSLIDKLGYQPNLHARLMRSRKTKSLVVLYFERLHSCYSNFLHRAFINASQQADVALFIRPLSHNDVESIHVILEYYKKTYCVNHVVLCPELSRIASVMTTINTKAMSFFSLAPELSHTGCFPLVEIRRQALQEMLADIVKQGAQQVILVDAPEADKKTIIPTSTKNKHLTRYRYNEDMQILFVSAQQLFLNDESDTDPSQTTVILCFSGLMANKVTESFDVLREKLPLLRSVMAFGVLTELEDKSSAMGAMVQSLDYLAQACIEALFSSTSQRTSQRAYNYQ